MSPTRPLRCRTLVFAIAAASLLSACSSTNDKKPGDDVALDASASPSAPAPVPTGASGKPLTKAQVTKLVKEGKLPPSALRASFAPTGGSSSGGTTGGTTGGSTTGGTTTGGSTTGGTTGPAKTGPVGPGVTATTIKIGISTFKIGDFAKNLGVNVNVGDNEAQAGAVIKYINEHGGMAGRKVIPSFYEVDFTTQGGTDGQFEAAACEQWTEDDKVFAAVNASLQRQQLLACLGKKDVVGVHNGLQIDEARMAPYRRYYYATLAGSGVIHDRAARTEVKALCDRGWAKGATIGIIYFDEAPLRTVVDKTYEPLLKACGMTKLVKQAAGRGLTTPDSTFVARFQQEKVTHVMFLGEGGTYPYTFMPAAENQLYRPKYSLRSDHAPSIQLQSANVPAEQLKNAVGIGWTPVQDVDAGGDPGPTNAADRLCLDIFKRASISVSDRGARLASMVFCSGLLFLKQALDKAPSVTSIGMAQAVAGMGTSFVPPATWTCRFSASQHDCQSTYREFAYDFEKRAFRYTSGNKPMATA